MNDNRGNFKSGKKPFSRSGGGNFKRDDRNFKSGGDRFNRNDRGDRNDRNDRGDRSGNDRFNKPGGKPGYFSKNNSSSYNNNNRSGGGFNRFNNFNKSDRTERTDRPERPDGNKRFNKFGGNDRPERNGGGFNRFNNFNKSDRTDRPERNDRFNRNERNDRNDRFDRNERNDRRPKFDNFKKFDKPRTFNKPDRFNNKFEKKAQVVSEPADTAVIVSTVEQEDSGMVYGRNAVIELLKSGKSIDKLFVQSGQREGSITMIFAEAVKKSIPIIEVEKVKLDSMINNSAHQGVIAMASEKEYCAVEDILKIAEERNEKPFILIADKIMDPHNLGAVIRTAECAGVHGIIIPKRHAAGVSPIVVKTSAGASIHMAIAKVANIATTIEELQEKGLWVFASALDLNSNGSEKENKDDREIKNYSEADYNMPLALVVGNEGEGLSPIIIQKSDFLVKIPMLGKIESLNVSCASAVLMYEVARQRMQNKK